jgi:PhoH-like ATPase
MEMIIMSPYSSDRRNFVIDTSVLAHHGESIHSFAGHNLYLPIEVLEELDNLKTRMDTTGAACRYVNRYLDQLRDKGNLTQGIEIDDDQFIFVTSSSDMSLMPSGLSDTTDNRIISVAAKLIEEGLEAIVVSRDISLRVRCDSLGIPAIDYEKNSTSRDDYFYNGLVTIKTSRDIINAFYAKGTVTLEDEDFYPNQGVILKSGQASALAIAEDSTTLRKFYFAHEKGFDVEGITPRSKEQLLAFELLLDPDVHMVSLTGMAGCGKTLLAISSAMKMLHAGDYKKLIISRPVQSTSKDIGFLPGTKEEKMSPWLQPIFDNLNVIYQEKGANYITMMMDKGIIEVEALTYVRGRTLPDTIFIIDEAQNITHHEAKALLTRMGEGSKIILIGDLEQIDSPTVDQKTSGLSSVVELFKEFEHSGHVRLLKGERSKLATFAAKVM